MAKVKIQGNASGTGVLTVTAPNTSTDRTITLPDATGTLLNSDGDGSNLTGVGVAGITSSADATAITIDSSENVGIGTSPSYKLHTLIGSGEANGVGILNTSGQGLNIYTDSTAANADVSIDQGASGAAIIFRQNGTERMRIHSGGGLTFNGDTSANNALKDYETGTWTPSFSGNIAFTTKLHFTYTKIGSIVHVTGYCNQASGTFGTSWSVSGLPYTSSGSYNTAPLWSHGQDLMYMMYMPHNTSVFNIRDRDGANMDSMSEIAFDCTYLTNQ